MAEGRDGIPGWEAVSVGTATLATILAAATTAGIFALAPEFSTPGRPRDWPVVHIFATIAATASLSFYVVALLFGINAPFQRTAEARRAEAKQAAISVFLQAFIAFNAAIMVILTPVLEEV